MIGDTGLGALSISRVSLYAEAVTGAFHFLRNSSNPPYLLCSPENTLALPP
jgi:hypothetical protein